LVEAKSWTTVVKEFLEENRQEKQKDLNISNDYLNDQDSATTASLQLSDVELDELPALWGALPAVVSRELPFSLAKFLTFDVVSKSLEVFLNSQLPGMTPIQVGVGSAGLAVSAFSGAVAGVVGAAVSHPADLILTLTNSGNTKGTEESYDDDDDTVHNKKNNADASTMATSAMTVSNTKDEKTSFSDDAKVNDLSESLSKTTATATIENNNDASTLSSSSANPNNIFNKSRQDEAVATDSSGDEDDGDWKPIVKELLSRKGGVANLYIGFPARASFFFLVIGLQFFLYDYAKNLLAVGLDDLTLVLDVFYAVRKGLVEMEANKML